MAYRFTQEDVYRGDGLNLYAYVGNNPVNYVDPSGYVCERKAKLYKKIRKENPDMSASDAKKAVDEYVKKHPYGDDGTGEGKNIVGSTFNDIKPTQDIVNPEKVAEYANKLKSGQYVEPIEVVEIPGKGKYIVEGHHRYVASQQTGIPVEIKIKQGNGPTGLPDWSDVQWKQYINEDQFWGD